MSFRNEPTAQSLGLTNKVSTWVGPDTSPPPADQVGLGDLWYVEHPTVPFTYLEVRRWFGPPNEWLPVNTSFLATAPLGNPRVEHGQNPDDLASTFAYQSRWYRTTQLTPNPEGSIEPSSLGFDYHALNKHRFRDADVEVQFTLRPLGSLSLGPTGIQGQVNTIRRLDFGNTIITTNASGRDTIPHALSVIPDIILFSVGRGAWAPFIFDKTSTSFTLQVNNPSTNAAVPSGQTGAINWCAIASV